MGKKIVIIGGVAAGPKAACRLKRLLPDADVTIIDQDSLISYGGCGIPYYVSGDVVDEKELRSTSYHALRDEAFFIKTKGVNTLTSTRALSIDRMNKNVTVQDLTTGKQNSIDYDELMLATGSQPVTLPIPGSDADGVFTVSDIHKAIEIKERIAKGQVSKAVVIGGGAIGIEMAEAFTDLWGVETALIEYMDQLLPRIISWTMATMLEKHLKENKVDVFTGEGAEEILTRDGKVTGVKTGKRSLEADLVIMAAGVRPQSQLARDAGLNVSSSGAIVVNERMQTSDPHIYAGGDCIEISHLVSGKRFYAPFGSMANKQGRVAADNMAGIPSVFKGGVGSFILKAFELSVGSTGLSLETALAEGFDADVSLTSPSDRAHFFPTQEIICLELIFDRRTRRVLGLQGVGPMNDALSARLDAAAVALCSGASIDDFGNIEMAYSPPFSSAIDGINAAAYVADNLCEKRMRQISMEMFYSYMADPSSQPDWLVLDVRHTKQAAPLVAHFGESLWASLPYDEIRQRYEELPTDKMLIIFCNAGSRSFEIQVFLDFVGRKNSLVLPGGFNVIRRMGADWLPDF
ncbi:MAG: pyridine nucleotide-disulfide oxidoreductase [Desulfobulbaceae bacterium S3730MH12]|nr:MAG: pyridine nucleotide-disulfide oxidoreductase [Desulfobulbaceae bacterium S5133MH15]OEU57663.1 MAG: pyridine nucleotide-disulfide oxidoreductase [Desulfobulbaceae bacterium S3730MH12]OEU82706.1 MAG: pyridine nucleotide-disulfide oxidoreductase [Desulfobulbaceae bacterium C00003063]